MQISFRYQRLTLRACTTIPVWFILARLEYLMLKEIVSDLVFILISIGITIILAPIFFKIVYRLLSVIIICKGKVYFRCNEVEFVFKKSRKSILIETINNINYEQISLYGTKMDKITIEYNIGTKQRGVSVFSPDILANERNSDFGEIYRRINLMMKN